MTAGVKCQSCGCEWWMEWAHVKLPADVRITMAEDSATGVVSKPPTPQRVFTYRCVNCGEQWRPAIDDNGFAFTGHEDGTYGPAGEDQQ